MKERQPLSDSALVLGALFVACTTICVGLFTSPQNAAEAVAAWNESLAAVSQAGSAPQNCVQSIPNKTSSAGGEDYKCVPGCTYTVDIAGNPAVAKVVPSTVYSSGTAPGQVYYKEPLFDNLFGNRLQGPYTCNSNSSVAGTMKQNVGYFSGANGYSYQFQAYDTSGQISETNLPPPTQSTAPMSSALSNTGTDQSGLNSGTPGNAVDLSTLYHNNPAAWAHCVSEFGSDACGTGTPYGSAYGSAPNAQLPLPPNQPTYVPPPSGTGGGAAVSGAAVSSPSGGVGSISTSLLKNLQPAPPVVLGTGGASVPQVSGPSVESGVPPVYSNLYQGSDGVTYTAPAPADNSQSGGVAPSQAASRPVNSGVWYPPITTNGNRCTTLIQKATFNVFCIPNMSTTGA